MLLFGGANGLRYLRYLRCYRGSEAVRPEKGSGVENCLKYVQNLQRQVRALSTDIFHKTSLCAVANIDFENIIIFSVIFTF